MNNNEVISWLECFSEKVRNRDIDGGKRLFSEDVVGFGTWTNHMQGLDALIKNQWSNVWPNTEQFHFDLSKTDIWFDDNEFPSIYTVSAPWSSTGVPKNGSVSFKRTGRSTIVLKRIGGDLLAVHTHFSFSPTGNLAGEKSNDT